MKIYKGAVFDTLQEGLEEAFKYELEHRCELNISDSNDNAKRKSRLDYLKELENWIESKKKEIDVPLLLPSKEKAKKKKSKGVYSTELYLSVL